MDNSVMEIEANAFAFELLMPYDWLIADIQAMGGLDIEDGVGVKNLAKKYKVTESVMAARIGQIMYD